MRLLHERHGSHVLVPIARAYNTIPGYTLPERGEQGDDQRWRLLDDHQHGQGGISVLRGHGTGTIARDTGTAGP